MRKKLRGAAVAIAVVATTGGAATVQGGETSRGGFDLAISTQTPGSPAGLGFHVLYKAPDDPDGKPPPVTAAVFELPDGLRIDDSAIPQCTATDEDFRMRGRDACPPETRVGDGTLTAMTGVTGADPVNADLVAYNGPGQIIEVVFFEGTNVVAGMDRLTIEDGTLVAHPPATPGGPPDGRTSVRELQLDLPVRVGDDDRPYITAPPACDTGQWTARARYEFEDGGKTVVTSESPCTPDADTPPAIQVSVEPRRVPAGKRRKFAVTAISTSARCTKGARVKIGKRRARTNRRGRVSLRAKFAKAGVRSVKVSKRGCLPGRTKIRVQPRR